MSDQRVQLLDFVLSFVCCDAPLPLTSTILACHGDLLLPPLWGARCKAFDFTLFTSQLEMKY